MIRKLALRASVLALLLTGQAAAARADDPAGAQIAIFKDGASSSGWIDLTTFTNFGLYAPVKVNGHDTLAFLWGGSSRIDKDFAASLGLDPKATGGLEVQLGDLTLMSAVAKTDDLQPQIYGKIIGHPVAYWLGEEVFKQLVVDIDYANHRVAFRDPKTVTKPAGSAEVPLTLKDGQWVVPISVDGAPPVLVELELGNVIGPLMVTPAYAEAHKLLEGRKTSQRLSGGVHVETVVTLDHINFAGIDIPQAPIALIPDTDLPPPAITGGVGLPLLAQFRLIIDYPRNRLYAIPYPAAVRPAIPKDRLGLLVRQAASGGYRVAFVAPNSPAEGAGFKKGEAVAMIDGKPLEAWPVASIYGFNMAPAGTAHTITMADGTVRQLKATDFF